MADLGGVRAEWVEYRGTERRGVKRHRANGSETEQKGVKWRRSADRFAFDDGVTAPLSGSNPYKTARPVRSGNGTRFAGRVRSDGDPRHRGGVLHRRCRR
ncbi:hypothetical protein DJ71_16550, partial [Halorubrum sp. E3]